MNIRIRKRKFNNVNDKEEDDDEGSALDILGQLEEENWLLIEQEIRFIFMKKLIKKQF